MCGLRPVTGPNNRAVDVLLAACCWASSETPGCARVKVTQSFNKLKEQQISAQRSLHPCLDSVLGKQCSVYLERYVIMNRHIPQCTST